MIAVSNAWKAAHEKLLVPEMFVEITCGIGDIEAKKYAEVTATSEAVFSNRENILEHTMVSTPTKYATLEKNLWVLDGSHPLVPSEGSNKNLGYASDDTHEASVTLSFPEVRRTPIPGLTITWCSEYGEYPTRFAITAKNGDTVVSTVTVENHSTVSSEVDIECVDYDSIVIDVLDWCLPDHRARLELVVFGHTMVFTKKDIISYVHEQSGCVNSGELPKNRVEFTLDNTDGRWNPSNPSGLERYLSERQQLTVRYGLDVNGVTEWIKAGTFYLSEWKAPANGLEASFEARDIFEYMLNEQYTGSKTGTYSQLIAEAFAIADLPSDFKTNIDSSIGDQSGTVGEKRTVAEVVQLCANASRRVMWQDREGVLNIGSLPQKYSNYVISQNFAYTHPEVTLSKPMGAVSVRYGEQKYVLNLTTSGETQTVDNELISTEEQASAIATWVKENMESRKTVTGEFRADPRLDLFDIVEVESKYGLIAPVVITKIRYAYTGAFRATYEGRVITGNVGRELGAFVLDKSALF